MIANDVDISWEIKFEDLNIPFTLFNGYAKNAQEYRGVGNCNLCQARDTHIFEFGELIVPCISCQSLNGISSEDKNGVKCWNCDSKIPKPDMLKEGLVACYSCIKNQKASFPKFTEHNELIDWNTACSYPENTPEFPFQKQDLFDLIGCPSFRTYQSNFGKWLFHCDRPMSYIGPWIQDDYRKFAPSKDAKAFFLETSREMFGEDDIEDWDDDEWWGHHAGFYAFKSVACGTYASYYDES